MAGEVFVAFRGGQGLDQTEKVVTMVDPLPVTQSIGGVVVSNTNPVPVSIQESTTASSSAVQTISSSVTRPSDTNAYAANDALSSSTSAPTVGGGTLTGMARASGGPGKILDAVFSMSAGSALQGELWIFDQAVTAINDNAAFSVSDSDILNLVGIIPFNCVDTTAANAASYVTNIGIGYTCVGSANLRYLVKVMAAVTPASAEVLSIRLHVDN